MKVCLLVQKEQRSLFDTLYNAISDNVEHCDIIRVSSDDQKNLKRFIRKQSIELQQYDRVILFLRYKKMMRQVSYIQQIPNLVIIEMDTSQNYCESKYKGRFSEYFRKIPWVRVICTGKGHQKRLVNEGFDACFVAKAYDNNLLSNLGLERDIELGFIGSLQSGVYQHRKDFLEHLATKEELLITKTNSGNDYLQMLNRIKFFVCADIPFREYMIKNFEAMACGCVLFTWDNEAEENEALGFKDMENVVLYKTHDELQEKLNLLRADFKLAEKIAKQGQLLVEEHHTWARAANQIVDHLSKPLREMKIPKTSFFSKLKFRILK